MSVHSTTASDGHTSACDSRQHHRHPSSGQRRDLQRLQHQELWTFERVTADHKPCLSLSCRGPTATNLTGSSERPS